jgi:protein involved in polysaccharide export with SLBB domain
MLGLAMPRKINQSRLLIRSAVILLVACIALALLPVVQSRGAQQEGQEQQPDPGTIKSGDLLVISIEGIMAPGVETRLLRRVGAEGEIWLPVLDEQPVEAGGLSPGQLQAEIRRALARRSVRTEVVAVGRVAVEEDQVLLVPQVMNLPPR